MGGNWVSFIQNQNEKEIYLTRSLTGPTEERWNTYFLHTKNSTGHGGRHFLRGNMNAIVNVPSWNLLGYATEENNCLSLSSVLSYNLSEFNIIFSAYFFSYFNIVCWSLCCLVHSWEYLSAFLRSIRITQIPIAMITHMDLTICCCVGSYKYFISILCNPYDDSVRGFLCQNIGKVVETYVGFSFYPPVLSYLLFFSSIVCHVSMASFLSSSESDSHFLLFAQ